MPEVRLTVNRTDYGGWKSLRLKRSIEQIAGTFELGVSELWPDEVRPREIAPGDECTVSLDGEIVITGHVDDVAIGHSGRQHEVTVAGRDATGDLVDSSAIHRSGKWTNAKAERIAADVCAPFKIPVRSDIDTGRPLAEWNIQEGEAAFECLERLARAKAVLLVSDARGGLVITRSGQGGRIGTSLVLGENILQGSVELSYKDRHDEYIVKGQTAESDALFGASTRLKGTAKDPMVKRRRPLIIIAEDQAEGETLSRRALWEANVRRGRSAQLVIKVQGWGYPAAGGAKLWQPNTIVHVRDPWLRTDAEMLIKEAAYILDESGSLTELRLTLPQAFDLVPMLPADALKASAWDMLGKQQKDIDRLKREQERRERK